MNEKYKVLLVEDLEDDIFLFEKTLRSLPQFELVGAAQDGVEAIAYLKGEGKYGDREKYPIPDIMVLDLKMPVKDGFEVLAWMKKQPRRPRVGVFTSSTLAEDKRNAENLGADLYQVKTYDPEQFARFIHWLARLVEADRKGNDEFRRALVGGLLIQMLARCA